MLNIELTKKQFVALLKAAYLGRWVAVGDKSDGLDDPDREEIASAERYLMTYAEPAGVPELVEADAHGKVRPSSKMDIALDPLIDSCLDEVFWEELTQRLTERDFEQRYTKTEMEAMSDKEFEDARLEIEEAWRDEFDQRGLDRLRAR